MILRWLWSWLVLAVRPARRTFDRLPLFWKMVTSLLVLLVAMSVVGTFLVARNITTRATEALTEDLEGRIGAVERTFKELTRLADTAAVAAAGSEALGDAVVRGDRNAAGKALFETVVNRPEVEFIGVSDASGRTLAKLSRNGVGRAVRKIYRPLRPEEVSSPEWVGWGPLAAFPAEFVGYRPLAYRGKGVGVVVAAVSIRSATKRAAEAVRAGVGYYAPDGRLIAAGESDQLPGVAPPPRRPARLPDKRCGGGSKDDLPPCERNPLTNPPPRPPARLRCGGGPLPPCERNPLTNPPPTRTGDDEYTLVRLHGDDPTSPTFSIGVSVLSPPVISAAAGARLRLVGLLAATTLALLILGAMMSRLILRQVRPLVGAARQLQAGDLTVRAPVLSGDEHGELARTFNSMVEALADRDDELRRAAQAKSDFFAQASHELRTPLFVIGGHAEMLLDPQFGPKGRAWRGEFGEAIKGASDQMLGLVNEILDLTRLEAGRLELDVRDVAVADELRDVLPGFEALARSGGLTVDVEVPATLPHIRADRKRFREIVQNLVSNSLKYTPEGGRVSLRVSSDHERLRIVVADTGLGIPADAQAHVFDAFFRVKGTEARGGFASSGLGLSITKRLVEAHGGTISVTSAAGAGTTFTVDLPVAGPSVAGEPHDASETAD